MEEAKLAWGRLKYWVVWEGGGGGGGQRLLYVGECVYAARGTAGSRIGRQMEGEKMQGKAT